MSDLTPEQRAEALRLARPFVDIRADLVLGKICRALLAAEAEVAELRSENELLKALNEIEPTADLRKRTERAEARVKRLEEALRHELGVTHGDDTIRRLRAALEEGAE